MNSTLGRCDLSSEICNVVLYWLWVWDEFVEMQPTFQWTLVAIVWNLNGLWAVYIDIWENGWWECWLVSVLMWTIKSHLSHGIWFISCEVAVPTCCSQNTFFCHFNGLPYWTGDGDLFYKSNPCLVSTVYLHNQPDNSIHWLTHHSWDCHGKLYGQWVTWLKPESQYDITSTGCKNIISKLQCVD